MEKEIRIITKNWGKINPHSIDEYIANGGYRALKKFVSEMTPESAVREIKASRLCGRGGAGFPTGAKMESVQKGVSRLEDEEKYFICNLDESEPGTYKDRLIVDNDPHLLLEGIIISAMIVGAKKAFIYINGNYEKQAHVLSQSIDKARAGGFIGEKILGSHHDLEVEVFAGAGAYICGEETALIRSIEGYRGEPKAKPPFPTQSGLFGKPTCVNNTETLCSIPWIISNGGLEYSRIGSEKSPGTKIFILNGAVKNILAVELPLGTTIRELIDIYGGGMRSGKDFWFAQIGGSSGRLALEKDLDDRLEYDCSQSSDGKIPLGSGAVLVVDRAVDIHDLLLSWTGFFRRESCGKCVPCREGTFRLWEIAKRMKDGKISDRDLAVIPDILWTLSNSTFCPFGKFASVAFSDAMENFSSDIFKKET